MSTVQSCLRRAADIVSVLIAASHPEPGEIPINDVRVRLAMQALAIEAHHDLEAALAVLPNEAILVEVPDHWRRRKEGRA